MHPRDKRKFLYIFSFLAISIIGLSSGLILLKNNQDLRSEAAKRRSSSTTFSGELKTIVIDDHDTGRASYKYYLETTTNGRPTSMVVNYSGRGILMPGRVEISGARMNSRGELTVGGSNIDYVTERRVGPQVATGDKRVAIVMLTWSDRTFPLVPANASAAVTTFDQIENYFLTESNNAFRLNNTSADVYGWSNSGVAYNCTEFGNYSFNSAIGGAVTNAIPVDRRSGYYSSIILVMPGCTASHADFANSGGRVRITSDKFSRLSVIEHELGHNYGAYHTGDLVGCPRSGGVVDVGCSLVEYGSYEPMGQAKFDNSNASSFAPYHREVFGWLSSANVAKVSSDTNNLSIYPLENSQNNVKEVRICRDANSFYTVENRTNTGFDTGLPSNIYTGAVIRLGGTSASAFPRSAWGRPVDLFTMGTYQPGQTLLDNSAGVKITVNNKNGGVLNVSVDYTGSPPTNCPFSVTPQPTSQPTPVPGGNDKDTTGVFRPSNGALYLKNRNTTGFADIQINYGLPGDYPVVGDWDGNGTDTIGIYRNGTFYLRNSNTIGFADIVFAFGQRGDQPIAGDWDNDGKDTIGIYRSSIGQFQLRNSNSAGNPNMTFNLGNVGDVGIAGDWNGDGVDTTGVFRPSNGALYLKNSNSTGFADIQINYGIPGDKPVTGDWDNDGKDTIGVYRNGTFLLRNTNSIGFADLTFSLGISGDMPIGGNWDGLPR